MPRNTSPGHFNLSFHVEGSRASSARDGCGNRTNLFSIYQPHQSIIPMLRNPSDIARTNGAETLLTILRRLPGGAATGLMRGLVELNGTLIQIEGGIHGTYTWKSCIIPGEFSLSIHQPVLVKKIENIQLCDLTKPFYCADHKVKEFIKDLRNQLKTIGCLSIDCWDQAGFGDTIAQLEWRHYFSNIGKDTDNNSMIKKVMLLTKIGGSFPLGTKKNEDRAFSMPLGNDGHWGIPGGAGMEITFTHNVLFGLYGDFLILMEDGKERRLKTDPAQTDLFLINKGYAVKDPGFTWQLETFLEWLEETYHLSARVTYQYIKHSSDRLFIKCNDEVFNDCCINTAEHLKEWHVHNLICNIGQAYPNLYGKPAISFFYKLPIAGERIIDNHTFGGQLHMTF